MSWKANVESEHSQLEMMVGADKCRLLLSSADNGHRQQRKRGRPASVHVKVERPSMVY